MKNPAYLVIVLRSKPNSRACVEENPFSTAVEYRAFVNSLKGDPTVLEHKVLRSSAVPSA